MIWPFLTFFDFSWCVMPSLRSWSVVGNAEFPIWNKSTCLLSTVYSDCGAGLRVRPQTGKTKGPLLVLARKTSTHRREWWWGGGEGGWQRCWTWGGWHVKTNAKVVIMNTSVGPINSWTWLAVREKGREPMRRVRFIGFQWHLGSNLICGISEGGETLL